MDDNHEKPTDQVGGTHYEKMAIDPFEYALANNLGMLEGTAIKYISRYESKGGEEDLEKAISCLRRLIQHKYQK